MIYQCGQRDNIINDVCDRGFSWPPTLESIVGIEVPSRVEGKGRYLALVSDFVSESRDTKSLMSSRLLLFPPTSDGTCFSHDKKEKYTRFTVK